MKPITKPFRLSIAAAALLFGAALQAQETAAPNPPAGDAAAVEIAAPDTAEDVVPMSGDVVPDEAAPAVGGEPEVDGDPMPQADSVEAVDFAGDGDDFSGDPAAPLSQQVEDLKQTVLELNRDLLILEEELLFPANTQIALFVSMDVGEFFELDAIKVKIDDKLVASHLYTPRQVDALFRGGVQRLFLGNLKSGSHEVTAFFTGKGPQGREYKRGATITLDKQQEPKALELRIVDSTTKLQPVFDIKEWQL